MKLSPPMIIILAIVGVVAAYKIITPSPEQQMMNQYTQQNELMQQQTFDMLNGMQNQTPQLPNGYVVPNSYQLLQQYQGNTGYSDGYSNGPNNSYPNNGYPNNGYSNNPNNGYPNSYPNNPQVGPEYQSEEDDEWDW